MKRRLRTRLRTRRDPGQSIVLIALILAILVGIVALSVDVGNAYAQQRAAQRAADSAAIEGMRVVIANGKQRDVLNSISTTLKAHRVPFDATKINTDEPTEQGLRGVKVYFILGDANGTPVTVANDDTITPNNVRYLNVQLKGTERTTFATLVGRADLPVVAGAYARRALCKPFPIGIKEDAFTVNDLQAQSYSDGTYKNLPSRRLFLRDDPDPNNNSDKNEPKNNPDTSANGRFVWLRWLTNNGGMNAEDAMAQALGGTSMTDDKKGPKADTGMDFDEAPWPSSNNWNQGKPDPYPQLPHIIGVTDVVYGTSVMRLGDSYPPPAIAARPPMYDAKGQQNAKDGQQVATQLQWHIKNRTIMNLPLYTTRSTGIREGGRFQIQGFSSFMIIGYGYDSKGDSFGKGWYLDIVKVSDKPCEIAEGIEEGYVNKHSIKLAGTTLIKPRYLLNKSALREPVDLVVVLDASGSMNWNWDGQGTLSRGSEQLAGLFDPPAQVGGPIKCSDAIVLAQYNGCQPADAWSNPKERRLYIAKQAIKGFLEKFPWQPQDRAAVVTYNRGYSTRSGGVPAGTNVLNELTKVYPAEGLTTNILGPRGSNSLVDQLEWKAATSSPDSQSENDLYKTFGASPGALGLTRASNELDKAPSTVKRKRAIIFFTDGLLNVNLEGVRSTDETLEANAGPGKPISQAVDVAGDIKTDQSKPASIYVIALSDTFNVAGLDELATGPKAPYLQKATDETTLPNLLGIVGNQVLNGTCLESEEEWEVPTTSKATDANGASSTRVGTLAVKDASGVAVTTVDIKANGSWEVPNLQPNTNYSLWFTIYYRSLDGEPRPYNYVYYLGNDDFTHNSLGKMPSLPIGISDTGLSYTQNLADPVRIVMNPSIKMCP